MSALGHADAVEESVARALFEDQYERACAYVAALADTGVSHGLIGPREVPRLWSRHVLNCAVVGELIPPDAAVIDVGSGAGLPGIPLALARPDLSILLVEPLLRRTRWLTATVEALELPNVSVHRGRAEDLDASVRAPVVTARAVARLERLGAWCAAAVTPGGELLALKGDSGAAELDQDAAALRRAGWVEGTVAYAGQGVIDPPTLVVRCRYAGGEPSRNRGSGRRGRGGSGRR